MSRDPLIANRTATSTPQAGTTRKDQKGYQLPDEYSAQLVNQEFDRLHQRINLIVIEAAALADLDTATATTAQCAARLNAFGEILRNSGLLRRE